MIHPDANVERALIELADALCTWERNTGIESVLILREDNGFAFRLANGKPFSNDDISDSDLMTIGQRKMSEKDIMYWLNAIERDIYEPDKIHCHLMHARREATK